MPIRAAAWLLFLAMAGGAAFFGLQCARSMPLLGAESAQETGAFIQMLEEREEQVLELLSCQIQLKDDTLDYVERQTYQERLRYLEEQLSPEQTSFRYQILSADGSRRPAGNLPEDAPDLEELVSQVYYLRVNTSGVGQTALESEMIPEFFVVETDDAMIYSAPSAKAAEESVVLRCGVLTPERMEAQDEFFRLEQEFTRAQMNFAFYLTLALALAAASAGLLIVLLWASGRGPEGEEAVLPGRSGSIPRRGALLPCGGTVFSWCC